MEKAYVVWCAFQDKILARIAGALLIGCTLLALVEVGRRYILGVSFEWQQDAVTFFILSAVFLYFGISQRYGEHLTVTVIPEALEGVGPRSHRVAEVIRFAARAFSLIFLLAMIWWGIPEVRESMHYESRTESLAFPMWPFLAALLVGLVFMSVSMVFQVWFGIRKLLGYSVPVEEAHHQASID